MRVIVFTMSVLALSFPAFAQDEISIYQFNAPGFFVAIVAGVILAAAFQLFLTNLSGAAGLSAARVVTHPSGKNSKKDKKENPGHSSESDHGSNPGRGSRSIDPDNPSILSDYTDEAHSAMRTISTGFGLMTMITASIALFFASWLALEIVGPTSIIFGVVVALVIWGVSYLLTFSLEFTATATMIGAIASVTKQSFKSIAQATTQLMRKSEGRRVEDMARSMTQAVRSELFGHLDLKSQIQEYIHELKPDYTPRDYRNELESLIDKLQVEEYVSPEGGPGGIQEIVRQVRTSGTQMSRENARSAANRLRKVFAETREEAGKDKARHEKVADSAMRAAGLSAEEAERTRKKMEEFLHQTGKEQLDPEGIKHDLEWLFHEPREGADALKQRLSSIDRDTIETLIAQRQDISKEDVHQYVDRVWSVISMITGRTQEQKEKMRAGVETGKEGAASTKDHALNNIEEYIASLDRPGLDAEAIRHDIELLFSDPKHAAEDLYNRAKKLNREDIMALVTTNRYISREDAEKVVQQIESIRDEAVHRAEQLKREIEFRTEQAKQEALHQADELRQTAASATWWIFITAMISGVAAVLGGFVAAVT